MLQKLGVRCQKTNGISLSFNLLKKVNETPDIRAALERLVAAHDADAQIPVSQWTANLTNAIADARAALDADSGANQAAGLYRDACASGDKSAILAAAIAWHCKVSWRAMASHKESHLWADVAAKAADCVQVALKELKSEEP